MLLVTLHLSVISSVPLVLISDGIIVEKKGQGLKANWVLGIHALIWGGQPKKGPSLVWGEGPGKRHMTHGVDSYRSPINCRV